MAYVGGSAYGDGFTSYIVSICDLHCYYSYIVEMLFLGLWLIFFFFFLYCRNIKCPCHIQMMEL